MTARIPNPTQLSASHSPSLWMGWAVASLVGCAVAGEGGLWFLRASSGASPLPQGNAFQMCEGACPRWRPQPRRLNNAQVPMTAGIPNPTQLSASHSPSLWMGWAVASLVGCAVAGEGGLWFLRASSGASPLHRGMHSNVGGGLPPIASSATPPEQGPSPNDCKNTQPDPTQCIPQPIPLDGGQSLA
jgi:hypothetical protein